MRLNSLRAAFFSVALLLIGISAASAQGQAVVVGGQARSQINWNFPQPGGEFTLVNQAKLGQGWTYVDNTGHPGPTELDATGFPLSTSPAFSHGGVKEIVNFPSQAQRPGNVVVSWTNVGTLAAFDSNGAASGAHCTGTQSGSSNIACSNLPCGAMTGGISGQTLTVTVAPGCTLTTYQPISSSGMAQSIFGVPTMIIGKSGSANCPSCTGTGGTGTYLVNYPQTIAPGTTIQPGGRNEIAPGSENTTTVSSGWTYEILATATSPNEPQNVGVYNINDEATYASGPLALGGTGNISGAQYRQVVAQGNINAARDLNAGGFGNCTDWNVKTPPNYYTYTGPYLPTALAASSITYNGGTDTYSVSFGSGNWTDKLQVIAAWPAAGTVNSLISLNGNTGVPILGQGALAYTPTLPTVPILALLMYDATLNAVLVTSSNASYGGLFCGFPPETFLQVNFETKTSPWIVARPYTLDPMTNWTKSYAQLIKTNFPLMVPQFETTDEIWNCASFVGNYFSAKTRVYIAADPTHWGGGGQTFCGASGALFDEEGKFGSTMGQDIASIYPNGGYEFIAGVQTSNFTSAWGRAFSSQAYANQTIAVQPGYNQNPTYDYSTRMAVDNYWTAGDFGQQAEVALAFCYFYQASGCATQSATMSIYMGTALAASPGTTITQRIGFYASWKGFALTCGQVTRPAGCVMNTTAPLFGYEGTPTFALQASDKTTPITSATSSGNNCVMGTAAGNGAGGFAGETIFLSAASGTGGGTAWSSIVGSGNLFTVVAATSSSITINLNCSAFQTFTSATLDFQGSANYISYLRTNAYLSPDMYALILNGMYSGFLANGGLQASQFTLAGQLSSSYPWLAFAPNIYGGYLPIWTCTACTTLGSTLTIGGTITGLPSPGQTVFGKGIAGIGNGSGSNTTVVSCNLVGSGPCGSNVGDTLTLSQAVAITEGTGVAMSTNATPPTDSAGNATNSPITSWPAIRAWNGNIGGCLMKGDLRRGLPANDNDNSPAFLDDNRAA